MSGSPISTDNGAAIGIVTIGGETGVSTARALPRLMINLPGCLLRALQP